MKLTTLTLTLSLTLSLLAVALSASCGASGPQISEGSPVVSGSTATAADAHRSGLIKLGALAKLPATDHFVAFSGYPGKGFHMGTVRDAATFDAVLKAGGWKDLGPIDWNRQMVVYLILDAQTNALAFKSWTLVGKSKARMTVEWAGIEPFYVDSTPAVIAVVGRGSATLIDFVAAGDSPSGKAHTIGTIQVP
jgi:hypothetical protein